MAQTGKATVFFGPGKPFQIQELPLPALEASAALVRVTLANICGSDLHFWRGDAPLALSPDGWIFGHEMTGRVAALGSGVTTDSLGRPLHEGDPAAFSYFYPWRPLLRLPPLSYQFTSLRAAPRIAHEAQRMAQWRAERVR